MIPQKSKFTNERMRSQGVGCIPTVDDDLLEAALWVPLSLNFLLLCTLEYSKITCSWKRAGRGLGDREGEGHDLTTLLHWTRSYLILGLGIENMT